MDVNYFRSRKILAAHRPGSRSGACGKAWYFEPGGCPYNRSFMSNLAFVFPGQGSQFAGMGKTLADHYAEAREVFDEADDSLGFALSTLCFEGPEEELKKTENTQPALLTASVAAYR